VGIKVSCIGDLGWVSPMTGNLITVTFSITYVNNEGFWKEENLHASPTWHLSTE
jgi:hypothetical protein